MSDGSRRRFLVVLLALFAGSGCAALIYEDAFSSATLWDKPSSAELRLRLQGAQNNRDHNLHVQYLTGLGLHSDENLSQDGDILG